MAFPQHQHHNTEIQPEATLNEAIVPGVEPQPLLAQVLRLKDALSYLGSSLPAQDEKKILALGNLAYSQETSRQIQLILDPYCLAAVDINPESRVKVVKGVAKSILMQGGWTTFLVKVHNEAGATATLHVDGENSKPLLNPWPFPFPPHPPKEDIITKGQVANRFLEMRLYQNPPLSKALSGLKLEYAVLQIYSKDSGQREGELAVDIGQGTQDVGFRNAIHILFHIQPAVEIRLRVSDENGLPTMASFIITDGIERVINDSMKNIKSEEDPRMTLAQIPEREPWFPIPGSEVPRMLHGIYPLPSRRLASTDEYPDFFFQPQIYRSDGEHVLLPPGKYHIRFGKGPEYLKQDRELTVPEGIDSLTADFRLRRWIDLSKQGWYSADHHIHAAGCSHYDSPEEGVDPVAMWRQILGEGLSVGSVLTWGPGWYHQKTFFSGRRDSFSSPNNVMRYDVEVSGFPSSHAGHLVLLNLKEDDYPQTKTIEDWPSYTLPVLRWAKLQGATTGYAHSANGLEPIIPADYSGDVDKLTYQLPNFALPKMDGIGANEYIVSVAANLVDFYSLGNTPAPWELNMWYQTLNCGFRPKISGETDFPCVYDDRVGMARNYFKPEGDLTFDSFIAALRAGRSYVSDGSSHIIDFSINGEQFGTNSSELKLNGSQMVMIKAKVAASLSETQDEDGAAIAARKLDIQPYWNLERARIKRSRKVRVELIVNGEPRDTVIIDADGGWKDVQFKQLLTTSAWVALRIYPSSHTNPIFLLINGKPIRVLESAEWCRKAVDQCWKKKESQIRKEEKDDAIKDYDAARKVYDRIIAEASDKTRR